MSIHRPRSLSTSRCPPSVDNYGPSAHRHPQAVDNSWGWRVDGWGQRVRSSTDGDRPVGELLKVLGMTALDPVGVVHRAGEKTGGLPVDNRWTAVENPAAGEGCGPGHEFYPWFSTAKPPVDNVSELRRRGFSTVCTGAMKTMSYLF